MLPPKRNASKSASQVMEDNIAIIKFYRNLCIGSSVIYISSMLMFFSKNITLPLLSNLLLASVIYFACNVVLTYCAQPLYSKNGVLVSPGTDLSTPGGISEQVVDLVLLTTGAQMLALLSDTFWLLLLVAPTRIAYLLFRFINGPLHIPNAENVRENARMSMNIDKKMKKNQNNYGEKTV